jgi:hypothetical protein
MKRLFAALLATMAITLAAAGAATADRVGDTRGGPACADIVGGQPGYVVSEEIAPGPNAVFAFVDYAAPTCANVDYTLVVLYRSGGRWALKYTTMKGDGTTSLALVITDVVVDPAADGSQSVCMSTFTSRGLRLYDAAPDRGCSEVASEGSPGGGHPAW